MSWAFAGARAFLPERANISFASVEDHFATTYAWLWERGIGETMACGTGACAVAAAAVALVIAPTIRILP